VKVSMAHDPPVAIGCVNCGREALAEFAVWAQCEGCGKACGVCIECGRAMPDPWGFVDEGLRVHVQHHHPDLELPEWRRKWLLGEGRRRRAHDPVELF
jgi:hypothetical protein